MFFELVFTDLKDDEGFRKFPYRCTEEKLTIGYGRNIEENGVTKEEAEIMLRNDIQESIADLRKIFPKFYMFPSTIQRVLVNMRYQLGYNRFRSFENMIKAVKDQDWNTMVKEMKDSLWYSIQTPNRAERLIKLIEEEVL